MTAKVPKPHLAALSPEDKLLNQQSAAVPVGEITGTETQWIIEEMLTIANGIQGDKKKRTMVGLAAPQLGISKRIIIVDVTSTGMGETPTLRVYVNPVITARSDETENGREGCFSTGNVCGIVERASHITIAAYDRTGQRIQEQHSGFTARIFQHEIDHLSGIRFPDTIKDDKKLHWVEPDQFGEYRERWQSWATLCARKTWNEIKTGVRRG